MSVGAVPGSAWRGAQPGPHRPNRQRARPRPVAAGFTAGQVQHNWYRKGCRVSWGGPLLRAGEHLTSNDPPPQAAAQGPGRPLVRRAAQYRFNLRLAVRRDKNTWWACWMVLG